MPAAEPIARAEAATLLLPYLADPDASAILAVSGGPDSVCLMRLAGDLRQAGARAAVTVATIDHGLRPGSREEADTVAGWAAACGFPHRILPWTGAKPRTAVQERAREARYGLLLGLARELGASAILTGHTLDDQAETLIMRLLHGSGIGGLAGMQRETALHEVALVRPFLDLRKARLVETCRAAGWPFLEDPSNADERHARTRLRRDVLPLLAREGLTAERLGVLARRAGQAEAALASRAAAVLRASRIAGADEGLVVGGAALLEEPDAILLRIVALAMMEALGPAARPIRLERFERIVLEEVRPALARGGRMRRNLGGVLIELRDGRILVRPEPARRPAPPRDD
jgi:tRNA(Ile)-lysidine synthase